MKAKETVKWMIDESFNLRPDAIVNVLCGKKMKAVLDKDSWENDENLQHLRTEFEHIVAPAFFEMGDLPIIGSVFNINIEGCKKCE